MKSKSFTLIELLVVIVIIGILAGVIMISTSSSIDKANVAKLKVFEESMANDLAANMVSRWKLDGNANDSWGGKNGVWYGAGAGDNSSANYRPESECVSGQCLDFDGTDDYVNCGSMNIANSLFTISLWMKANYITGQNMAIDLDSSVNTDEIWISGNGVIRSYTVAYSEEMFFTPANDWIHIALIKPDTAKAVVYKNGILEDTVTDWKSFNNAELNLSYRERTNGYFYDGLIDDVRIYDAALSSSQIKQNYIAGLDSLLSNGNISRKEYNERIKILAYE